MSEEMAPGTGVENVPPAVETPETPAAETQDVDFFAALVKTEEELSKVSKERDNYRKGMLKAKGKLPDDEEVEDEDLDARIERKAREILLADREALLKEERSKILGDAQKQVNELKLALRNKGVSYAPSTVSKDESPAPKDHMLSSDQLRDLKARGWSDEKIEKFKQNLLRSR